MVLLVIRYDVLQEIDLSVSYFSLNIGMQVNRYKTRGQASRQCWNFTP
jgi:hypothetical protein